MANVIHKNDIGHVFEITVIDDGVARNISAATLLQLLLRDPTGVVTTHTASLTTDGTDGKLEYATVSGDLHTDGWWWLQAKITEGASPIFHTESAKFLVREVFS